MTKRGGVDQYRGSGVLLPFRFEFLMSLAKSPKIDSFSSHPALLPGDLLPSKP